MTNRGLEPAAVQVVACLFFIHAVSLNLLSPRVSKCAPTKGAYDGDSRADSCDSGSNVRCEALVKTQEGLLKAWRGNLPWRYSSSASRCQRGGSAGRKEKVMTHQTSQNPPPSPLLVYGKWNAVFFSPSSLRRSSSWQAPGSGPGLMFVCGIVSSLSVGANPANGFNYVRRTLESLLAVWGRAWIDGVLALETDKPLFCIITRPFIPVIYTGEDGIYQLPN